MNSFYGGLNGQSFDIPAKNILHTKVELDADINKGGASSISVREFVIITYGKPGDDNYDAYRTIDDKTYGKSFNSTLWLKVYIEDVKGHEDRLAMPSSTTGMNYIMLASMTGNTPILGLKYERIKANLDPYITEDPDSNLDNPKFTIHLPRSLNLLLDNPAGILDCDEDPEAIMDSTDPDYPVLYFALPQSQVIEKAVVSWLKVGQDPKVHLNITDINRPILELELPVSQQLQEGLTTVLDANLKPSFSIDFTDVDKPVINFSLPQSLVMSNPDTTVIGPDGLPSVSLNSTNINSPKLEFELPRAVRFYYGSLLGERTDSPYTLTEAEFADYGIGDYYINAASGFIYHVTSKSGNTCTFDYVACIQSPLPDVVASGLSPYTKNATTAELEPTIPLITRSFTNASGTAWKLEFKLPQAPLADATFDFVGAAEDGSVTVEPKDENTLNFDFQIPRGSRMFAGTEVTGDGTFDVLDAIVGDAMPGDLYLNTETGAVYKLDKAKIWRYQNKGLKGPVGDALNIVREYRIPVTPTTPDSLATGRDYILLEYVTNEGNVIEEGGKSAIADEIFSVTFTSDDKEVSYWYFYTEDKVWGRVLLTGGVMNLIDQSLKYVDSPDDNPVSNKTYSIHYINLLIGGKISDKDKDKVAFSAEQIYALLSWDSFEDAAKSPPDWFPEDSKDPTTLSAEEVIDLMSWGSMAKLIVTS